MVTVKDTTPPELFVSVSPHILWPPNHKMVEISPTITVRDLCDTSPTVQLISITMNEGDVENTYYEITDETQGDGHTANDIQVDDQGRIFLRAERSGKGDGRTYTLHYRAADASGNQQNASAIVAVPHNKP